MFLSSFSMYPKDFAVGKGGGSKANVMENVVGHCFVLPAFSEDLTSSAVVWADKDINRFFVTQTYDAYQRTFCEIKKVVFDELERWLQMNPPPSLKEVTPLATLDIFCGVGGLSAGRQGW